MSEESADLYPASIPYFPRFKQDHPRQAVLLHMNGNARDPRFQTQEFFAGHWMYFNGARVLSNVPAVDGQSEIAVDDPGLFQVNMGLKGNKNEDIGLCLLDADGKPNWHQAEQVQLLSINVGTKTILVRRGQFGTKPRAFPAGIRTRCSANSSTASCWPRRRISRKFREIVVAHVAQIWRLAPCLG